MFSGLRILGLVPARGGSKGLPGKNIAPLAGRPLIAYTLEAARASRHLDRCVVSTDCEAIARVCRECGGDVPFLRPPELARDDTPTMPVVLHALAALGEPYDAVLLLQPTSPLRTPADIDAAIEMLAADPSADSVISVVRVGDRHPSRMKTIRDGLLIDPPFVERFEGQRRQDLEEFYVRNGSIYLTRTSVLRDQQSFKGHRCLAFVMPEERSVNIDERVDLLLAAVLLREQGRA